MVGGPDQGSHPREALGESLELAQGLDLPSQVVEPDGGSAGRVVARLGADPEQPQIMVVVGIGDLQERRPRGAELHRESESVLVEAHAAIHVPHVQHGVVEPLYGHGASFVE